MWFNDTDKVLGVLYTLIVLFLVTIYAQGDVLSQPETASTLGKIDYIAAGSNSAAMVQSMNLTGESLFILIGSVTVLFGFAWFFLRSRYE